MLGGKNVQSRIRIIVDSVSNLKKKHIKRNLWFTVDPGSFIDPKLLLLFLDPALTLFLDPDSGPDSFFDEKYI